LGRKVDDAFPTPWKTQMWVQVEDSGRGRSRGTLPSSQHFERYKDVLKLRDETRKSWQASLTHTGLHTTHTKWLVHSWSTLGARTSHAFLVLGQATSNTDTLDSPWPKLREATTFPLIVYFVAGHGAYIQMVFLSHDSRVGVPKVRQMGLPQLWSPITLQADLSLWCGLKQSCSSCRKLFNSMSQALCSQVNQVDSQLFLVGNQTDNLIPALSFGHNLCFKCPNEQCEPILDIYTLKIFQCHRERREPLRFDPWNRSLKFRESTGTPSPKMGVALGMWGFTPSYSLTLSYTLGNMWCDSRASSWPAPLWPLCLESRALSWLATLQPLCPNREPKARVVTVDQH